MNKLLEAFNTATSNGIEKPRLKFLDFTISLAPRSGKNPGFLYVKSNRTRRYLGKISPEGSVHLIYDAVKDIPSIATELEGIVSDPYTATKMYGYKTGVCSCCGRKLTNKMSVELGIGPICREKYGWVGEFNLGENEEEQEPYQELLPL